MPITAAEIAQRLDAKKVSGGWQARCPAHDDKNASLSISEGNDGKALLHCHAGCSFADVVARLGAKPADLFADDIKLDNHAASSSTPAKRRGKIVAVYDYTDAAGELVFQVCRYEPKDFRQRRPDPDKPGAWLWNMKGVERVLYNLPAVAASVEASGVVFVVEGEKDVHSLGTLNLCATCNAGGAGKWLPQYTESLRGAKVVIIADKDDPGRKHAELVASSLHGVATSVVVVELPDRGDVSVKDAADWIEAGGTLDELRTIVASAPLHEPKRDEQPKLKKRNEPTPLPDANGTPPDPVQAAKAGNPYPTTDLGNAERLVAWHGDKFRWDTSKGAFRTWDGTRWAEDSALAVHALAADTARRIRQEAAVAPRVAGTRDIGQDLFAWAIKSESRDRLSAMIEVAKARPGIAASADTFDSDPMLFNCRNGTIELKTGKLREHRRSDMLTKVSPVEYHPQLKDERLTHFLNSATNGDQDVINFLQALAGYTLTGDTSEEILILIYGPEAAGKSTFLDALRSAMGDYAHTIDCSMLMQSKNGRNSGAASPEIACLVGARLAAGSESDSGKELAEAVTKNLTGGEPITARNLYADQFSFRPQFKLWLAMNHCPKVSADDGAIWRRILRVGFEHTVPPERKDKTLKPYLRDPSTGGQAFLAWAVSGCLIWQREGLHIPDAVKRSTEAYRQESDPLATYIEDVLTLNPSAWTLWATLWDSYNEYASENGVSERYRISPKRLQERLKSLNCASSRRYIGRGMSGVELRSDWKSQNHVAHDAYDASPKTFPSKPFVKKSFRNSVICDMVRHGGQNIGDSEQFEEDEAISFP